METEFTNYSYALMVLLAIRTLSQIASLVGSVGIELIIVLIFTLIYLGGLIGVFLKKRWGSIITIIIAVIDLLLAFTLFSGIFAFGAAAMDVVLLFLGYKEYKIRETS